jgi:hypothetical protein
MFGWSIAKRDCIQFRAIPTTGGPPYKVNSMPRLSLDEKKNYVILDSIRNDYEVDNVTKRIYQAILQGIKTSCHFSSFSPHFKM